jgi:hypothetical protein
MVAMLHQLPRVRSILIAAFVQALLAELKLCGEIGPGNVHKAIAKTHNRPGVFTETAHDRRLVIACIGQQSTVMAGPLSRPSRSLQLRLPE